MIVVLSKHVQRSSCNSVLFIENFLLRVLLSHLEVRWECPLVFTVEWSQRSSHLKSQSGENLASPVPNIAIPDWLWVRCTCLIGIAKQIAYEFKQGFSLLSRHAPSYSEFLLHQLFCCSLQKSLTVCRPTARSYAGCGGRWAGATSCLSAGCSLPVPARQALPLLQKCGYKVRTSYCRS